jgi:hypothetical protein
MEFNEYLLLSRMDHDGLFSINDPPIGPDNHLVQFTIFSYSHIENYLDFMTMSLVSIRPLSGNIQLIS